MFPARTNTEFVEVRPLLDSEIKRMAVSLPSCGQSWTCTFRHFHSLPSQPQLVLMTSLHAQVLSRSHVRMHVWERGAGATLACGTGACATVVAGVLEGRLNRMCRCSRQESHSSITKTVCTQLLNVMVLSHAALGFGDFLPTHMKPTKMLRLCSGWTCPVALYK